MTHTVSLIPLALLEKYEPQKSWLFHDNKLHGIGHLTRVFILQELICDKLEEQKTPVNRDALRWAAISHDVGRVDDGTDFEHGFRSAQWMKENLSERMSPETLDTATYIVHWHAPSDDEAPVMTTELKVLKDADALDRARLGDLNPSYLRTDVARDLVDVAEQLYQMTQKVKAVDEGETFEDVVTSAQKLGIVAILNP